MRSNLLTQLDFIRHASSGTKHLSINLKTFPSKLSHPVVEPMRTCSPSQRMRTVSFCCKKPQKIPAELERKKTCAPNMCAMHARRRLGEFLEKKLFCCLGIVKVVSVLGQTFSVCDRPHRNRYSNLKSKDLRVALN